MKMQAPRHLLKFLFLALVLPLAGPAPGQMPSASPAQSPAAAAPACSVATGLRVFSVAHSFHSFVSPILLAISHAAGLKDAQAQLMNYGGSTVENCWEAPYSSYRPEGEPKVNTAKDALTAGTVDVLTLSPIWMPDEGIEKFTTLGLEHNPNIRVTVQEFWLPNDTYEPIYPLDTHKQPTVNHDAATIPQLTKAYNAYFHDVEEYVRGINQKLGKPVIRIVPVGAAVLALREKIIAGQAPGIEKQSELFRDPWGHPNGPIQVLSAYCHYAVIYGRSPVGLPLPAQLHEPKPVSKDPKATPAPTPNRPDKFHNEKLNRLLQELAWDAVIHNPMSGVTADGFATAPAR